MANSLSRISLRTLLSGWLSGWLSGCLWTLGVATCCVGVSGVVGCGSDGARDFGGEGSGGSASGGGGANGSGGAANTGGAPASGGAPATGGSGSGGQSTSGGASGTGGGSGGSGGRAGTGGRATTGGGSGTGGRSATGGTDHMGGGGTGGAATGGISGTGGVNGMACDKLATDYQREIPMAKECTLANPVKQCQSPVSSALGCGSNCRIYVQTPAKLAEIQATWTNSGCDNIIRLCPAIACAQAQPGYCASVGLGGTVQCQQGPVAMP
ncbi:MAG: hypothetical protein ABUS79_15575 [Pseudomonadota bacterium]